MPIPSRVACGIAAILSLPSVALSAWAAAYIAHSIVTESWYRHTFLAYGVERALVDVVFVAGIIAAAWLAIRRPPASPRRALAYAVASGGALAGIWTEVQFWGDADPQLPPGAFVVPYIAWAAAFATPLAFGNARQPS
ncbi:MAG: hypothetical protein ABI881_07740 [Betaproteobacteria bacterium]